MEYGICFWMIIVVLGIISGMLIGPLLIEKEDTKQNCLSYLSTTNKIIESCESMLEQYTDVPEDCYYINFGDGFMKYICKGEELYDQLRS